MGSSEAGFLRAFARSPRRCFPMGSSKAAFCGILQGRRDDASRWARLRRLPTGFSNGGAARSAAVPFCPSLPRRPAVLLSLPSARTTMPHEHIPVHANRRAVPTLFHIFPARPSRASSFTLPPGQRYRARSPKQCLPMGSSEAAFCGVFQRRRCAQRRRSLLSFSPPPPGRTSFFTIRPDNDAARHFSCILLSRRAAGTAPRSLPPARVAEQRAPFSPYRRRARHCTSFSTPRRPGNGCRAPVPAHANRRAVPSLFHIFLPPGRTSFFTQPSCQRCLTPLFLHPFVPPGGRDSAAFFAACTGGGVVRSLFALSAARPALHLFFYTPPPGERMPRTVAPSIQTAKTTPLPFPMLPGDGRAHANRRAVPTLFHIFPRARVMLLPLPCRPPPDAARARRGDASRWARLRRLSTGFSNGGAARSAAVPFCPSFPRRLAVLLSLPAARHRMPRAHAAAMLPDGLVQGGLPRAFAGPPMRCFPLGSSEAGFLRGFAGPPMRCFPMGSSEAAFHGLLQGRRGDASRWARLRRLSAGFSNGGAARSAAVPFCPSLPAARGTDAAHGRRGDARRRARPRRPSAGFCRAAETMLADGLV